LRPEDVVKAARSKRHPLHKEFIWDDEEAAERYRMERARYIIRSLEVVVTKSNRKGEKESTVTLKQYTSLGTGAADDADSRFHDTQEALSDEELRKQVMLKIWRQLINLKRQYKDYQEFAEVWAAVEVAEKRMAALPG
jgi:tRNA A37 N6-isopentenylltransferase MiaA